MTSYQPPRAMPRPLSLHLEGALRSCHALRVGGVPLARPRAARSASPRYGRNVASARAAGAYERLQARHLFVIQELTEPRRELHGVGEEPSLFVATLANEPQKLEHGHRRFAR